MIICILKFIVRFNKGFQFDICILNVIKPYTIFPNKRASKRLNNFSACFAR